MNTARAASGFLSILTRMPLRPIGPGLVFALLLGFPAQSQSAAAKYYFRVAEVQSSVETDDATKAAARDLLEKDLAGRTEFTSVLGAGADEASVVAELKRRKLQGFKVSVRLDSLKKELKAPRPGGRLKQLALQLKLSVFGVTLPGEKLAFSGEGEASIEAEVVEKRLAEETQTVLHDVMVQAVRQAVDQAVSKLSMPKSVPINENKRKAKRK